MEWERPLPAGAAPVPWALSFLATAHHVNARVILTRAFCWWFVRHNSLECTPFAHLILPKGELPLLQLLEPKEWEGLLSACRPPGKTDVLVERATACNQAILWVLADTSMRVWEVCGLLLSDVDQERGILTVKGKGFKQRQLLFPRDAQRDESKQAIE